MRAFRISLVLLVLLGALIVVSTVYQRRVCNELTALVQSLPERPGEGSEEAVGVLTERWDKVRPRLLPIVHRSLVYGVEEALCDLESCTKGPPEGADQYGATRRRLLGAIENMRRSSRGSFGLWS